MVSYAETNTPTMQKDLHVLFVLHRQQAVTLSIKSRQALQEEEPERSRKPSLKRHQMEKVASNSLHTAEIQRLQRSCSCTPALEAKKKKYSGFSLWRSKAAEATLHTLLRQYVNFTCVFMVCLIAYTLVWNSFAWLGLWNTVLSILWLFFNCWI